MYCTQCGADYRKGFTECSTCSIPLVKGSPPEPEPDEKKWTPATPLGSPGTRLIYLYLAQTLIIGIVILFRGSQFGGLPLLGAVCGVASAIAILTRRSVALFFIYAFLVILVIVGVLDILQSQDVPERSDSFITGQVTGTFLSLAWFFYFHRRRTLFA